MINLTVFEIRCFFWLVFLLKCWFVSEESTDWQVDLITCDYLFFTLSHFLLCFSPRCLSSNEDDRRILSFHLDKDSHTLYVAFSSCVVRISLSRCERHTSCQKWVLFTRYSHLACNLQAAWSLVKSFRVLIKVCFVAQVLHCFKRPILRVDVSRSLWAHFCCYRVSTCKVLKWHQNIKHSR